MTVVTTGAPARAVRWKPHKKRTLREHLSWERDEERRERATGRSNPRPSHVLRSFEF